MAAFEKDHPEELQKAKDDQKAKRKGKKDKLYNGTGGKFFGKKDEGPRQEVRGAK